MYNLLIDIINNKNIDNLIEYLNNNKYNINCQNNILKNTIGHYACWSWNKIKILQELINYGLNINLKNKFGWTCLHEAYWQQNKTLIDFLISKGANQNITDIYNKKPSNYLEKIQIIF